MVPNFGKMFHGTGTMGILVSATFLLVITGGAKEAGAGSLSRVQPSLKSIDLTRTPTTEELMAAGQLGGQLYPTGDIDIADDAIIPGKSDNARRGRIMRNRSINLSFGRAMEQWNRHEYADAARLLREHVEQFPESQWAAEALLHLGCDAQYHGRYGESQQHFERLLAGLRDNTHEGARLLAQKAKLRLAVLKVLQNNFAEATRHFQELSKGSDNWRERTYASHWLQRLGRYTANELEMLTCGSRALAHLLEQQGKIDAAREVAQLTPDTRSGHSLKELAQLAAGYDLQLTGLRLTVGDLHRLSLPAIVHLAGKEQGDSGHYWIIQAADAHSVDLYDPQAGISFHQSHAEFGREWDGVVLTFAATGSPLPGTILTTAEMEQLQGGCCGIPNPENRLGKPNRTSKNPCGSPAWDINMVNMNLYTNDVPLWYSPPIGPPVEISLSYNSQSAIARNEPFGNKWQFNYGSYLVQDTGGRVTIIMPDGSRDTYGTYTVVSVSYSGSGKGVGIPVQPASEFYPKVFTPAPYQVFNTLTKLSPTRYELQFPDGTVYVYDRPAVSGALQQMLVEIRDRHNQKLTFGYDSEVRLATITDANGQKSSLTYNADGLVTRVVDPFGRSATFAYDGQRNLVGITDMGGYSSSLGYDADVYLTGITNPRGTTRFSIEPAVDINNGSDAYPEPGGNMWSNYRITVTNPLGGKEEFYYDGYHGQGWYVAPRDYIEYVPDVTNNLVGNVPKTRYGYTVAFAQTGEISTLTSPEGEMVQYGFDSSGNRSDITDAVGNIWRFIFNDKGRVTTIRPPKWETTAKGETNLAYAANGLDLTGITDDLGSLTAGYNATRDLISLKDRLNRTTTFAYNGYGQLLTRTDPLSVTTSYVYGTDHRLQQVQRAGIVFARFTYDAAGRPRTVTDGAGITLTYDYDSLDKIRKVTYPDGRFDTITYGSYCPNMVDSITDRAGRTTSFSYDDLGRPVEEVNPEGGITGYGYDPNGNLVRLTDPNGTVTGFDYDLNNRLVKKSYQDGKTVTYAYTPAGLIASRTGGRGIAASYAYDPNHNLTAITYSDTTPAVTLGYDDLDRLVSIQDGSGTENTSLSYDAESQLVKLNGPWSADDMDFTYDGAGRMSSMAVPGAQLLSYSYDALGRVTAVGPSAGSRFTYGYTGANPLVQSLTRPDGSITYYQYDLLGRLTNLTTKAPPAAGGATLATATLTFNPQDQRASETVTGGAGGVPGAGATYYNYSRLNQILTAQNPGVNFTHDGDGNLTGGYTPDGYPFTATYDAENRLISFQYTDGNGVLQQRKYRHNAWGFRTEEKRLVGITPSGQSRFVNLGGLTLQERDGANATVREYWWGAGLEGGAGGLLGLRTGGQLYSYLYDGRGNVTALLDPNRATAAAYGYDVFGRPLSSSGPLVQPFRFATKSYDEATGLQYYGYRFYSAPLGRWLTRDPLEEFGGLNLYAFVGNNPLNNYDPLGLESFDDMMNRRKETRTAVDNMAKTLDDFGKDKMPKNFKDLANKKAQDFVKKNTGTQNEYKRLQDENKQNSKSTQGLFDKLSDLWRRAGCALSGN